MNWDQMEGKWKQFKGQIKEQWGKLTDSDMERIAGKRDQLVGAIQERYGLAKEEAQKQVDEYVDTLSEDRDRFERRSNDKARGAGQS